MVFSLVYPFMKRFYFNKRLTGACSLMAEHPAHNGYVVGSNPARLNVTLYIFLKRVLLRELYPFSYCSNVSKYQINLWQTQQKTTTDTLITW